MFSKMRKTVSVAVIAALVMTSSVVAFGATDNTNAKANRAELYAQEVEGEKDLLEKIRPRTGWKMAQEMVKIGSSKWGFRLGGTPESREAADMVYDKFEALGMNPDYSTYDTYGWRFKDSSFEVLGTNGFEIDTVSTVGTKPTPKDGVTGEIVHIGYGTEDELATVSAAGVSLENKIVLFNVNFGINDGWSQIAPYLEEQGALGAIYWVSAVNAQHPSGDAMLAFNWCGSEESDLPMLNTSKNSFAKIIDAIGYSDPLSPSYDGGATKIEANMISNVEVDEDAIGFNVIGQITGSKYPDEYIIVNAHTDAHFQGFQDDTLPIGAMCTIAEAMQKSDFTPDRTFLFISMDGEEFGNYGVRSDWLAGSWGMLKDKKGEWVGNVVASYTIELFGAKGTTNFGIQSDENLNEFTTKTIQSFKDFNKLTPSARMSDRITPISDAFSFAYHGIPSAVSSGGSSVSYLHTYHTQFDEESYCDYNVFAESTKHYAKYLARLDKQVVSPYDLTHSINKYLDQIDFDALKSTDNKGELESLAKQYKKNAEELYDQNVEISTLYNKAKGEGKDLRSIDKAISSYNKDMRKVIASYQTGTLAIEGLYDPRLEISFYQLLQEKYKKIVSALDGFDPATSSQNEISELTGLFMSLPAGYTVPAQSYERWKAINKDFLNPDLRDTCWTQDIAVQYFDIYNLVNGYMSKLGETNPNYSEEIAECNKFIKASQDKIDAAYKKNVDVFKKTNIMFPIDTGKNIVKEINDIDKKDERAKTETKTTAIKTAQKNLYLKKGQKITLPLVEYTDTGIKTKLTYRSGNKKVAAVDSKGKVVAKKKGKTTITVTSANGKSLKFTVNVATKSTKVKTVKVKYSKTMKVGTAKNLKVTISPKKATKAIATFKSSNKSILTVDKAGKITAKKKGSAKITIKAGAKKKIVKITVK